MFPLYVIYTYLDFQLISRFSSNSESSASELLENFEEMFAQYCIYTNVIFRFESLIFVVFSYFISKSKKNVRI